MKFTELQLKTILYLICFLIIQNSAYSQENKEIKKIIIEDGIINNRLLSPPTEKQKERIDNDTRRSI